MPPCAKAILSRTTAQNGAARSVTGILGGSRSRTLALKRIFGPGLCLLFAALIGLVGCSSDPKVRRQKFLDNGNKLFAKAEYKQAALYYRRALREDPQFSEGYYRMGLTSINMGNWAETSR